MKFTMFDSMAGRYVHGDYDGTTVQFQDLRLPVTVDGIMYTNTSTLAMYIDQQLKPAWANLLQGKKPPDTFVPMSECPQCKRLFKVDALVVIKTPQGFDWRGCEGCFHKLLERTEQVTQLQADLKQRENQLTTASTWVCLLRHAAENPEALNRLQALLPKLADQLATLDEELHSTIKALAIPE